MSGITRVQDVIGNGSWRRAINSAARALPTWPVYVLGLMPAVYFFALGIIGASGPEPIKALEHDLGLFALQLLIAGLSITPLRVFAKLQLFKFRRALGLLAFIYVMLHFLVWAILDLHDFSRVYADLTKRPYIIVGMAALMMLVPLALTSSHYMQRALGRGWQLLHRLTYPIAVLAAVHFIWLRKGFQIEPWLYMALIVALLALRLPMIVRILR